MTEDETIEEMARDLCMRCDCRVWAIIDGEFDGTCPDPEDCNWRVHEEIARAQYAIARKRLLEEMREHLRTVGGRIDAEQVLDAFTTGKDR